MTEQEIAGRQKQLAFLANSQAGAEGGLQVSTSGIPAVGMRTLTSFATFAITKL